MSPSSAALDTLRRSGIVVASDTAEYHQIGEFAPQDATTNRSLVYAALTKPDGEYAHLIEEAVGYALRDPGPDLRVRLPRPSSATFTSRSTLHNLIQQLVQLGIQILKIIPGRVSISIDPRLAHDKHAIIAKAQNLIALFAAHGYTRTCVLIKIPATYAGILACRALAACTPPIHTNATLIFGLVQARTSADEVVPVAAARPDFVTLHVALLRALSSREGAGAGSGFVNNGDSASASAETEPRYVVRGDGEGGKGSAEEEAQVEAQFIRDLEKERIAVENVIEGLAKL
ncbi:hypothetical protein C0992_007053 [Termitomyces sp. T32_za158]|nr:hypothetical protein C0992_007053 [Termitomyces sp. T32_za158]